MLRTGIQTIIRLSPYSLYVYVGKIRRLFTSFVQRLTEPETDASGFSNGGVFTFCEKEFSSYYSCTILTAIQLI